MGVMVQKKFTIRREQQTFLSTCKELGFANQSSLVRTALDDFMQSAQRELRRAQLSRKAKELAEIYNQNNDLTDFTDIDGDDFYEAGGRLGNRSEPHHWSRDSKSETGSGDKR